MDKKNTPPGEKFSLLVMDILEDNVGHIYSEQHKYVGTLPINRILKFTDTAAKSFYSGRRELNWPTVSLVLKDEVYHLKILTPRGNEIYYKLKSSYKDISDQQLDKFILQVPLASSSTTVFKNLAPQTFFITFGSGYPHRSFLSLKSKDKPQGWVLSSLDEAQALRQLATTGTTIHKKPNLTTSFNSPPNPVITTIYQDFSKTIKKIFVESRLEKHVKEL